MKDIYIADLANFDEGKLFDGFFLVLAKQQRTTKTNKPYLNLILGDKTGQLEGRVWDRATRASPRTSSAATSSRCAAAPPASTTAADEGRPAALAQEGEVDKMDMLPATTCDVGALWRQLEAVVESFTNPDLKRLLTTLLADPALAQAYREAPAARQLHHAWLGGLLEHVVSLHAGRPRRPHYPHARPRPAAVTGVILHDIGKIRELSWESASTTPSKACCWGISRWASTWWRKPSPACPGFPAGCARWCCT
jgi:3'-5' exoribonuclease